MVLTHSHMINFIRFFVKWNIWDILLTWKLIKKFRRNKSYRIVEFWASPTHAFSEAFQCRVVGGALGDWRSSMDIGWVSWKKIKIILICYLASRVLWDVYILLPGVNNESKHQQSSRTFVPFKPQLHDSKVPWTRPCRWHSRTWSNWLDNWCQWGIKIEKPQRFITSLLIPCLWKYNVFFKVMHCRAPEIT